MRTDILFDFIELAFLSMIYPQRAGRIVLKLTISSTGVAYLIALILVLNAILMQVNELINPEITVSQGIWFIAHSAAFATLVLITYSVGNLFGGTASLKKTAIILCWMSFVIFVFQSIQLVALAIITALPVLGPIGLMIENALLVFSILLVIWLYVNLTTVVHEFKSALKVFFTSILVLVLLSFVLSILIQFFSGQSNV